MPDLNTEFSMETLGAPFAQSAPIEAGVLMISLQKPTYLVEPS